MLDKFFDWIQGSKRLEPYDALNSEFNAAIFAKLSGRGSRTASADILSRAERKNGFRIFAESPFSFAAAPAYAGGGLAEIDPKLIPEADDPWDEFIAQFRELQDQQEADRRCEQNIYPFLSETLFLPHGDVFSHDHLVLFDDGHTLDFGGRAWGRVIAEWARHAKWEPCRELSNHRGEETSYVDFYMYNYLEVYESSFHRDLFQGFGYDTWLFEVFETIRMKTISDIREHLD